VAGPVQDVKIFGIQARKASARVKLPWIVRWSITGRHRSRSFRTKSEAERYRSLLVHAKTIGERFDEATGEPATWLPGASDLQLHVWTRHWLAEQWHEWQPRTRTSAMEALARFVPLVVLSSAPPPPPALRAHLYATFPPLSGASQDEDCERWLERWCLTLGQLNRQILSAVERQLATAGNGAPLAASTAARYRKIPQACIRRAVDLDILDHDPWPPSPKGRSQRKVVRSKRVVDVRRLPDPATMAAAIAAIPSHQPGSRKYQIMTAVAYYAGLRPSEVVMLRHRSLSLPATAWGRIDVVEADVSFDEPGEPKTGRRQVPIPPCLVDLLKGWVDEHHFTPDELLFRTRTGRRPTASNWARAWRRALRQIHHEPLRVYDCRHAAATTWLLAGAPLGEVARRLGHSVETLVSTYVGALTGDESLANDRIAAVISEGLPRTDHEQLGSTAQSRTTSSTTENGSPGAMPANHSAPLGPDGDAEAGAA
jgi:integrase